MSQPVFSVVIPAYNQANFLTETIQSVLGQTFQDFEILIVNDRSTDHTSQVLDQFTDPRVKVIHHPVNKGLPASRNTGMDAAVGTYIALLDADDLFHPEKLAAHLAFLNDHPEISITYNARFDLHHSSTEIRDIYRPPVEVGLQDFVQGFPFSPSEMVIRREAVIAVNGFDPNYICGGEDLDFPCRLAMANYQFASVDRVLNLRRYHSGRRKKNLLCRVKDYTRAIETILVDPRCSDEIKAMLRKGLAHHYSEVAWWALAQNEIDLGREIIGEVLLLDPSLAAGALSDLHSSYFFRCLEDRSIDHEALINQVFSNLPAEVASSEERINGYCARGYLLKATLSMIYGQEEDGKQQFQQAVKRKVKIDREYVGWLTSKILSYQREMGEEASEQAIKQLFPYISHLGGGSRMRALKGSIWVNRAFESFLRGNYQETVRAVGRAIQNDPRYLFNRGVLSITARSSIRKNS